MKEEKKNLSLCIIFLSDTSTKCPAICYDLAACVHVECDTYAVQNDMYAEHLSAECQCKNVYCSKYVYINTAHGH